MHLRCNLEPEFLFAPVPTHAFGTNFAMKLPSLQERATCGPNLAPRNTNRKVRSFNAGDR